MEFTVFYGVSVIAVCIIASAKAVPVTFVDSAPTFENLNKNYEVVDGPKEFLVPLAPFKSIWGSQSFPNTKDKASDLDYMVYGKVYLMKALGISDRSLFHSYPKEDLDSFKNGDNHETVVLTRNLVSPLEDHTHSKGNVNYNKEGIQFSPKKSSKRPYRFKFWNTPRPASLLTSVDGNHSKNQRIDIRRIQERSAEALDTVETSSNSSSQTKIKPISSSDGTKHSKGVSGEGNPSTLDEEALELFEELAAYSPLVQFNQKFVEENNAGENKTKEMNKEGAINVDDRFLIHVPNKPNFTQCPKGQKRTHLGTCKPIAVHNNSPRDGIFNGRITSTAQNAVRKVNSELSTGISSSSSHLSTLFKSFVQLEKRLEKAIKDTERQLSDMVKTDEKVGDSKTKSAEDS